MSSPSSSDLLDFTGDTLRESSVTTKDREDYLQQTFSTTPDGDGRCQKAFRLFELPTQLSRIKTSFGGSTGVHAMTEDQFVAALSPEEAVAVNNMLLTCKPNDYSAYNIKLPDPSRPGPTDAVPPGANGA